MMEANSRNPSARYNGCGDEAGQPPSHEQEVRRGDLPTLILSPRDCAIVKSSLGGGKWQCRLLTAYVTSPVQDITAPYCRCFPTSKRRDIASSVRVDISLLGFFFSLPVAFDPS